MTASIQIQTTDQLQLDIIFCLCGVDDGCRHCAYYNTKQTF